MKRKSHGVEHQLYVVLHGTVDGGSPSKYVSQSPRVFGLLHCPVHDVLSPHESLLYAVHCALGAV
jgi:hypothetical protein